jgi:intracellular septation protein A
LIHKKNKSEKTIMKFLFDLFPVLLFFAVFKWGEGNQEAAHTLVSHYMSGLISGGAIIKAQAPIMLATVVGIAATAFQIAYLLLRRRKVDAMLWVSLIVIVFFGGATIYFITTISSNGNQPSCTGVLHCRCCCSVRFFSKRI